MPRPKIRRPRARSVRISEDDDNVLTVLGGLQQIDRAEIIHAALGEYLNKHREELIARLAETERALASGDIDAFARAARSSSLPSMDGVGDGD
jgi:hypothetical protein